MEQITMRCMAPKRELRYSNADEVLADLETFRKAPDTVFPYENPWIPGDDSDATVIWNQPVAADEADRDVKVVPSGGEAAPKGEEPPKPQQEEPTKAGKTKRRVIMGVTIAVLLVIIALLLVQVWNNVMAPIFTETATYRVPELEGKTVVEAEQYILENEEYTGHFTITVSETTVYDVDYEPGQIISQTPKGGTTTKSDSTEIVVTLCGDGTTEESIMPSIIGGDYKEWAKLLEEDYDVVVKYDGRNSDDFEEGKIILTEPVAGTKLSSGQSVMLYYSKGPAVKPVTMIPLEGLTLEQAKSKLEELGLELGEPVTVESDMAKGTVVYQSVPTGTEVTPGTKVNLHISAGPAEVEDPVEPPSDPVQDPTPQEPEDPNPGEQDPEPSSSTQYYKLRITLPSGRTTDSYVVVTVPGNSSPLYQGTLEPDETALNLTLSGNVEGLSVTVDGEPYDNYILEQVDALE
jgi:serine/threonine-protein kinase